MAWARLVTYPGGTEEQYEAVLDELGEAMNDAPGRRFLAAGPSERGWQIFMVWESQQAFMQWARQHVGPAHERAGERGWKSEPEVLDFETFLLLD
jgi:heme-degrading monooxygenase HmoA